MSEKIIPSQPVPVSSEGRPSVGQPSVEQLPSFQETEDFLAGLRSPDYRVPVAEAPTDAERAVEDRIHTEAFGTAMDKIVRNEGPMASSAMTEYARTGEHNLFSYRVAQAAEDAVTHHRNVKALAEHETRAKQKALVEGLATSAADIRAAFDAYGQPNRTVNPNAVDDGFTGWFGKGNATTGNAANNVGDAFTARRQAEAVGTSTAEQPIVAPRSTTETDDKPQAIPFTTVLEAAAGTNAPAQAPAEAPAAPAPQPGEAPAAPAPVAEAGTGAPSPEANNLAPEAPVAPAIRRAEVPAWSLSSPQAEVEAEAAARAASSERPVAEDDTMQFPAITEAQPTEPEKISMFDGSISIKKMGDREIEFLDLMVRRNTTSGLNDRAEARYHELMQQIDADPTTAGFGSALAQRFAHDSDVTKAIAEIHPGYRGLDRKGGELIHALHETYKEFDVPAAGASKEVNKLRKALNRTNKWARIPTSFETDENGELSAEDDYKDWPLQGDLLYKVFTGTDPKSERDSTTAREFWIKPVGRAIGRLIIGPDERKKALRQRDAQNAIWGADAAIPSDPRTKQEVDYVNKLSAADLKHMDPEWLAARLTSDEARQRFADRVESYGYDKDETSSEPAKRGIFTKLVRGVQQPGESVAPAPESLTEAAVTLRGMRKLSRNTVGSWMTDTYFGTKQMTDAEVRDVVDDGSYRNLARPLRDNIEERYVLANGDRQPERGNEVRDEDFITEEQREYLDGITDPARKAAVQEDMARIHRHYLNNPKLVDAAVQNPRTISDALVRDIVERNVLMRYPEKMRQPIRQRYDEIKATEQDDDFASAA